MVPGLVNGTRVPTFRGDMCHGGSQFANRDFLPAFCPLPHGVNWSTAMSCVRLELPTLNRVSVDRLLFSPAAVTVGGGRGGSHRQKVKGQRLRNAGACWRETGGWSCCQSLVLAAAPQPRHEHVKTVGWLHLVPGAKTEPRPSQLEKLCLDWMRGWVGVGIWIGAVCSGVLSPVFVSQTE